MTNQKNSFDNRKSDKLSARASIFTWIIGAALCWALAVTSFSTITGSNDENNIMTAQNGPSAEEAAQMEQILPAAGGNNEKN